MPTYFFLSFSLFSVCEPPACWAWDWSNSAAVFLCLNALTSSSKDFFLSSSFFFSSWCSFFRRSNFSWSWNKGTKAHKSTPILKGEILDIIKGHLGLLQDHEVPQKLISSLEQSDLNTDRLKTLEEDSYGAPPSHNPLVVWRDYMWERHRSMKRGFWFNKSYLVVTERMHLKAETLFSSKIFSHPGHDWCDTISADSSSIQESFQHERDSK